MAGDGEKEDRSTISLLEGDRPQVMGCRDEESEAEILATWLLELTQAEGGHSLQQHEIAIFARRHSILKDVGNQAIRMVSGLRRKDLRPNRVPEEGGVAFGTMHRAKGMEFRAMAVIGCSADNIPDAANLEMCGDEAELKERMQEERTLLYVAATRPREKLLITYTGPPSPFLDG